MSNGASTSKPYTIVGAPVHENRWVEELQQVVPGTTVRARWLADNAIITVFVPDSDDLVSTADQLIRFRGEQLDRLHSMGT